MSTAGPVGVLPLRTAGQQSGCRLEGYVKLTNRELDLIESMDSVKSPKIKGLVALGIVVAAYWILRYAGMLDGFQISFDSLLMFYLVVHVGNTFSDMRSEDRYVELLRRYVNNDADTITALSERSAGSDE